MSTKEKTTKPAWMNDDIGEQHLPPEKPVLQRSIHLDIKGRLARRTEPMRSVLLDMPEWLKDRFSDSISGSVSVGIMILAEMKLTELEAAGEQFTVDVDEWRGEAAER